MGNKKIKVDIKTSCLLLKKALYGLVQVAHQGWKRIFEVFYEIGFKPTKADPCLFVKKGEGKNSNVMILYVDDRGNYGTPENIRRVLQKLSTVFKLKNMGKMEQYVGCHLIESKEKTTVWIHLPKIIKHLENMLKEVNTTEGVYKTSVGPRAVIMQQGPEDLKINDVDQRKRSGVGMLLYLMKHSQPDLANLVQKLSNVLDEEAETHQNVLTRYIQNVVDTRMYALRIRSKLKEEMFHQEGFFDSDHTGERETRFNAYGCIVYFRSSIVLWKSKSSKNVTLLSTEAEYFLRL
jgi:Reverse transcriptase (RNA-dependent DNA polymerase)